MNRVSEKALNSQVIKAAIAIERHRCESWVRVLISRWPKNTNWEKLSPLQRDFQRTLEGILSGHQPKLWTKRFANKT